MKALVHVAGGVRIRLLIQPRAPQTELAGVHGDALKIRIAAPPVDGAANEELLRFLGKTLGVAQRQVEITAGRTGKRKTVLIHGICEAVATQRLGLVPGPSHRKEQPTANS